MGKESQFIPQAVENQFKTESLMQCWDVSYIMQLNFETTEIRYKHAEGFLFWFVYTMITRAVSKFKDYSFLPELAWQETTHDLQPYQAGQMPTNFMSEKCNDQLKLLPENPDK